MDTMYVLNWDPADTNTDTYGSQISYHKNGSVSYQNELQPAGKKIHWWQTNYFGDSDPLQTSRYGSKRLPQIPRNQSFSLIFKGQVIPEGSVGLTVRTFDETGQLLDQKMTLASDLDFQLKDEEAAFEISLVKFNNTKLQFQGMLLIPATLTSRYQIEPHLAEGFLDFIPQKPILTGMGKLIVRQFHRVVDAVPIPKEQQLEPIRVVFANDSWDASRLQQVSKDFKHQFQLQQVNWSASDLKSQALLDADKLKN